MILAQKYENGIDEVWYESSTVVYTKFVENPDDNFGQLYVTFKGGSTYVYKNVEMPTHYLQFKHEMMESSSGKSLNAYIKPNYQYEKLENIDLAFLAKRKEEVLEEQDTSETFFISGHRDITEEEFDRYYAPAIEDAIANYASPKFVVGDYYGADIMAQNFLMDVLNYDSDKITVYHMCEAPRNINPKITKTKGGYQSDDERDTAMTLASSYDIAFVRPGKLTSGTAQNLARRHLMG